MDEMPTTPEKLMEIRDFAESFGLRLSCVEGGPPMDLIVQGLPGRENYKRCIEAMGVAGIPLFCYNFMPWSFRVGRTSYEATIRGGALSSEWRWDDFDDSIRTAEGVTTHEEMWRNLEYFLKAVIPTAEKAGVFLAAHPDDPPVDRIRGLARILTSPDAFERMLRIVDSPHNGITFCQGCFSAMGVDVPATIRRLGDRVHFVHFRDVIGTAEKGFIETFQDDGQTDMHAAMQAWKDVGFNGIIRPDHVPLLPGIEEGHDTGEKAKGYFSGRASGYTMMGRLFAVGYMRGLMDSVFGRATCSAEAQRLQEKSAPLTASSSSTRYKGGKAGKLHKTSSGGGAAAGTATGGGAGSKKKRTAEVASAESSSALGGEETAASASASASASTVAVATGGKRQAKAGSNKGSGGGVNVSASAVNGGGEDGGANGDAERRSSRASTRASKNSS